MSSVRTSIYSLEYQEAGCDVLALPELLPPAPGESISSSVTVGVSEEEVERRVRIARDTAITEAEERVRIEVESIRRSAQEQVAGVLKAFEDKRVEYFRRVEREVVQLSLAIARKILQREVELDPTLLAALVRIALDRMQCGSAVRIRVSEKQADLWRRFAEKNGDSTRWEIVSDATLDAGACIVETELGTADFGFEAQLRAVEESFVQLLAHNPNTGSRDAAAA